MTSSILPTYTRAPLSFVKGQGIWLTEAGGERYMDLGSGIAVNALGHANPALVDALTEQAQNLWHTSNLYTIPNQEKLACVLVEATFADKVFFTNSGAEAMECCLKMARKYFSFSDYGEKTEIIAFTDAFHGRTLGTIAAAGGEKLLNGFGPELGGFVHVPFGDLGATEAAITDATGAILVEPIQGEGGIVPAQDAFLRGLRALCDERGLLLIMDEIQCGMGRTGRLFAHEWSGVEPDIMAVAKGIGGGFPLGACLANDRAAAGMVAGTHGSTYGGNPLACAVGLKVMDIVARDEFLAEVRRKSGLIRQSLEGLVASHPDVFTEVRGIGMMLGIQCKCPNMDVVNTGYDQHILVVPGGQNVVRVLPPLTITDAEITDAVSRLDAVACAIEAAL